MAIISASGLFTGDRLCRCSNMGRLYWPYLYLASNGFGRFEVNPAKIISTVFATFSPRPTAAEIEAYIREYRDVHLLFLYEANGQVWAQWDTPSNMLPRHKRAEDRRSPAPPPAEFSRWLSEYHDRSAVSEDFQKVLGDLPKTDQISENCEAFPEKSTDLLLGVGVGGGEGKGKNKKPSAATSSTADEPLDSVNTTITDKPDPRHRPVRSHIEQRIREACPDLQGSEWTPRDGRALQLFLREHPNLSIDLIIRMIDYRTDSQGTIPAPAHVWIPELLRYSIGPLDRFGKLSQHRPSRGAVDLALGTNRHDSGLHELVPSIELPRNLDRGSGAEIWELTQGRLGETMNKHTYETWIKPTHGEGVDGNTLYVRVPTGEFDAIEKRFSKKIREALPDHIENLKYFHLVPASADSAGLF